jgi:hypothetical protein
MESRWRFATGALAIPLGGVGIEVLDKYPFVAYLLLVISACSLIWGIWPLIFGKNKLSLNKIKTNFSQKGGNKTMFTLGIILIIGGIVVTIFGVNILASQTITAKNNNISSPSELDSLNPIYKPLNPEIKKKVHDLFSNIPVKYRFVTFYIDCDSPNRTTRNIAEDLVTTINNPQMASLIITDGNRFEKYPMTILFNKSNADIAEYIIKELDIYIKPIPDWGKDYSYSSTDSIKIFISGEPLFNQNGQIILK